MSFVQPTHSIASRSPFRAQVRHTLTLLALTAAVAFPDSLPEILSRLDAAAPSFRAVSATIRRIDYTAVIKDTSEERGLMRLKRAGKSMQGVVDISSPDKRTYAFKDKQAQIYVPNINTVQIYDMGKLKDQVNEYLTMGFGSSGKELSKNYTITLGGPEALNGAKTTRVVLQPKSKNAQELIQHIEMWIPEGGAYAIQQKVHLKGGDYKLFVYSDIKINPALPDQQFELKVPKNAKKEFPGK